jgi:hypothetical protein
MACWVRTGSSVAGGACDAVWAARAVEMKPSESVVATRRVPRGMQQAPVGVDVGL